MVMDENDLKMTGGLFGTTWIRLERRLNFT
jgi:hypothetical protein